MTFAERVSIPGAVVAQAEPEVRAAFIRRTYAHLAGAVGAFVAIEYLLVTSPAAPRLLAVMVGGRFRWLLVLGLFMAVGYLADRWARSRVSKSMQYLGLGLYVLAEAVLFLPLIYVAAFYSTPNVLPTAAVLTIGLFAGLTGTVFITKKDFSFLGGALTVGFFVALGLIVASLIFGFDLGLVFSGAMILLAAGTILYDTSNVLHHYEPDQHVAAALALFAAIALLFWYILRLLMELQRD